MARITIALPQSRLPATRLALGLVEACTAPQRAFDDPDMLSNLSRNDPGATKYD